MPPRRLTDAAAAKQLTRVTERIDRGVSDKERLALLRRQASLGDQRDAAILRARRAAR